jgi:mono/diheme cytochrome c family protein
MKRVLNYLKYLVPVTVLLLVVGGIHVSRTWDRIYDLPVPEVHASTDSAVIKRGEYLVFGPAHCVECHSASFAEYQTLTQGALPPLVGGVEFSDPILGRIYSKNLTPDAETGIGRYSDGQIARMMRWSVRPDGRASIRTLMPFHNMSDDDVIAIISFLRQQPPVRHAVPSNEYTLVGKIIKSFAPPFKPRDSVDPPPAAPASEATRERGEYLARYVGNCTGCHTQHNGLTLAEAGPQFAGGEAMDGLDFPGADKSIGFITPNITPQDGSALLKFPDRAIFIARFKFGGRHYPGSPMPWEAFSRMSEADIGALYEFLHSLAPQKGPTGEPTVKKG